MMALSQTNSASCFQRIWAETCSLQTASSTNLSKTELLVFRAHQLSPPMRWAAPFQRHTTSLILINPGRHDSEHDAARNNSQEYHEMTSNVGGFDRIIRVLVGLLLISTAFYWSNEPYSYLGWLGLIPIATALFGYCPLYSILDVRTDR